MASGSNQKLKLLYLTKMFHEKTDENNGLTMAEIIAFLAKHDIRANRKTLYQDFAELKKFDIDILSERQGKRVVYFLASRKFELPEMKLLVDSVQSAKFISDKKSRILIKKLESLVSDYEASELHRQVIINGRIKTMNESIYYHVDKIHRAIHTNRQVDFRYGNWDINKKIVPRHGGKIYHISPWHLIWDNEYYYLLGYDSEVQLIKHFRLDKMLEPKISKKPREGAHEIEDLDIATYSNRLTGMFAGPPVKLSMEVKTDLIGVIIDRFGSNINLIPKDDEYCIAHVDAVISNQFLGWIIGLGPGIKIIAPADAVQRLKEIGQRLLEQY